MSTYKTNVAVPILAMSCLIMSQWFVMVTTRSGVKILSLDVMSVSLVLETGLTHELPIVLWPTRVFWNNKDVLIV